MNVDRRMLAIEVVQLIKVHNCQRAHLPLFQQLGPDHLGFVIKDFSQVMLKILPFRVKCDSDDLNLSLTKDEPSLEDYVSDDDDQVHISSMFDRYLDNFDSALDQTT